MLISDLLGQYYSGQNNGGNKKVGESSGTSAVQRLVSSLRDMGKGTIFEGTINSMEGGRVMLGLSNGQQISARLDANLPLTVGQSMFFQVKTNDGVQIAIRPFTVDGNSVNLTLMNALGAAKLPATGENLSMVNTMMQEQMPIDAASLAHMARTMNQHPGINVQTLVQMQKFGIPITKEMAAQFENYIDDRQAINKAVESFMDELPQVMSDTSMPPEELRRMNAQVLSIIVEGLDEGGDAAALPGGTLPHGQMSEADGPLENFNTTGRGAVAGGQGAAAGAEGGSAASAESGAAATDGAVSGQAGFGSGSQGMGVIGQNGQAAGIGFGAQGTLSGLGVAAGGNGLAAEGGSGLTGGLAGDGAGQPGVLDAAGPGAQEGLAQTGAGAQEGLADAVLGEQSGQTGTASGVPGGLPGAGGQVPDPPAGSAGTVGTAGQMAGAGGAMSGGSSMQLMGAAGEAASGGGAGTVQNPLASGGAETGGAAGAVGKDGTAGTEMDPRQGMPGSGMDIGAKGSGAMESQVEGTRMPGVSGGAGLQGGLGAAGAQQAQTASQARSAEAGSQVGDGASQVQDSASEHTLGSLLDRGALRSLGEQLKALPQLAGQPQLFTNGRLNPNIQAAELLRAVRDALGQGDAAGSRAIAKLFGGKEFSTLMKDTLEQQWMVKPRDVAREGNKIDSLYEKLENQISRLENVIKATGHEHAEFSQAASDVRSNVEFMNHLNEAYTYVQIPLKMSGQNASGELFVYTNKKSLAQKGDRELTAFLHLDLDNLGSTDVSVRMKQKDVSTDFYLEDDASYALVKAHLPELEARLNRLGYTCKISVTNENRKVNFVEDFLKKDQPSAGGQLHRYSFDMRA